MIRVKLREAMDNYRLSTGETLTYRDLARLTGLSQQTVESIASRPGYNATLITVDKLCRVLCCQPCDLLEHEPEG